MNKEFIRDFPVKDLIPFERNPRINKHAIDSLAKAIKRVGNNDPIEVNEQNVILCGHARKMALDKLGIKKTDIIVISGLTEEQQREYRITNNKTGELAEWDFEILEADFTTEQLVDFGFDLKDLTQPDVVEDEAPPVPETPRTVMGDIYTLGRHRVMCGDSTIAEDVGRLMDGKKADMVFTDPPYGVNVHGGKKKGILIAGDLTQTMIPFAFEMCIRYTNQKARFYFCGGEGNIGMYFKLCERFLGKMPKLLIWVKNNFTMKQNGYHCQYELIFYTYKDGGGGREHWYSGRKEGEASDVWQIHRDPTHSYLHPTQKPIEIAHRAINNSLPIDGLLFEPFFGSGSTLIACEQTNRICYGMDIDEKYCDVTVQRWVNFTGGQVILNGQPVEWDKT